MVEVRCRSDGEGWICQVRVDHAGEQSAHTVVVRAADLESWAGGKERWDAEDLVSRSFAFLLDREPPGSILRRFDLSVIQRYFPEYDRQFRRAD